MTIKNIILALADQMPFRRFLRNLFKGHLLGLFHKRSHYRDNGQTKVMYNTKKSAVKSAEAMKKKHDKYFSTYKCPYCNGFHIGKNRDNK